MRKTEAAGGSEAASSGEGHARSCQIGLMRVAPRVYNWAPAVIDTLWIGFAYLVVELNVPNSLKD